MGSTKQLILQQASVIIDKMQTDYDTPESPVRVLVLRPFQVMRSSLALTLDILEAANRISPKPVFQIELREPKDLAGPSFAPDIVVLPGLGITGSSELDNFLEHSETQKLLEFLSESFARELPKVFATSCSGVFLFAEAGLIDNMRATTSWWLAPLLKSRYPKVRISPRELIVDADRILTAGAALAHSNLILHIVERFAGRRIADQCRRVLLIDDRPSQLPYMDTATLIASDPALRRAETYILTNIFRKIKISEIADAAQLGQRTFARRLAQIASLTPIKFLQSLRADQAIQLKLTTRLSHEEIAERVGYSDGSALRRILVQHTGKPLEQTRQNSAQTD